MRIPMAWYESKKSNSVVGKNHHLEIVSTGCQFFAAKKIGTQTLFGQKTAVSNHHYLEKYIETCSIIMQNI
jgi:hypothetical protein